MYVSYNLCQSTLGEGRCGCDKIILWHIDRAAAKGNLAGIYHDACGAQE